MRLTIDHLAAALNLFVILGLLALLAVLASIALGIGPIGTWLYHLVSGA